MDTKNIIDKIDWNKLLNSKGFKWKSSTIKEHKKIGIQAYWDLDKKDLTNKNK